MTAANYLSEFTELFKEHRNLDEHMQLAPQALHTSGPKTLQGKQRVSMNGVTHGLSGQNVFLTMDEYPAYFELGADYIAEFQPVGVRETQLTQKIIDCNWRLNRLAAIENNLLNAALVDLSRSGDAPADPQAECMLAQAHAFQQDCDGPNAFDKLGRYETRLSRIQFKTTEELERLQKLRRAKGPDTFVLEDCKAWLWYSRMLEVHQQMQAVERRAEKRSEMAVATAEERPANSAESATQTDSGADSELLGKKAFHAAAASPVIAFPAPGKGPSTPSQSGDASVKPTRTCAPSSTNRGSATGS